MAESLRFFCSVKLLIVLVAMMLPSIMYSKFSSAYSTSPSTTISYSPR